MHAQTLTAAEGGDETGAVPLVANEADVASVADGGDVASVVDDADGGVRQAAAAVQAALLPTHRC